MRNLASLVAVAVAGLAGRVSAHCSPNFCLNNLREAPNGLADCNSFLLTTVIEPTPTVFITPSVVLTKTHTDTVSSTITVYKVVSYQPSSVDVSTHTSVDVVASVAHSVVDSFAVTTSTDTVTTTTTALHTSVIVSFTTTTRRLHKLRREPAPSSPAPASVSASASGSASVSASVSASGSAPPPQPTTIVPSDLPGYAAICRNTRRYQHNCLRLGAVASVTTVVPSGGPVEVVLSSTRVASTASAESALFVSSTSTETSTQTLPSRRSTTTVVSSSVDVVSTSLATSYTSTRVAVSAFTDVVTLATTTTTTTSRVPTPTPSHWRVASEVLTDPRAVTVIGQYLTVSQVAGSLVLSGFPYGSYAVTLTTSKNSAIPFFVTAQGYVGVTYTPFLGQATTLYLVVVDNALELVAAPAATATHLVCTVSADGQSIAGCNYNLLVAYYSFLPSVSVAYFSVTTDPTQDNVITVNLSA